MLRTQKSGQTRAGRASARNFRSRCFCGGAMDDAFPRRTGEPELAPMRRHFAGAYFAAADEAVGRGSAFPGRSAARGEPGTLCRRLIAASRRLKRHFPARGKASRRMAPQGTPVSSVGGRFRRTMPTVRGKRRSTASRMLSGPNAGRRRLARAPDLRHSAYACLAPCPLGR